MSDEPFESWVEQVNRPMCTEEHVCVVDESSAAITVKESVVRCRDCEHYRDGVGLCDLFAVNEWDPLTYADVEPNGFCAWGERKG